MRDAFAEFSNAQAITVTAASTNYINLGTPNTPPGSPAATKRDIGGGNTQAIDIEVVEAFAALTSLQVDVEVDDNSAFTSPKVVATTGAIPVADLVVGKRLPISMIPPGADEQFMRLNYTVVGVAATAGQINAGLTFGIATNGR